MRNELKSVLATLQRTKIKVEKFLAGADNEEWEAKLENELGCIEEAIEALNNID